MSIHKELYNIIHHPLFMDVRLVKWIVTQIEKSEFDIQVGVVTFIYIRRMYQSIYPRQL